jgi:flagellar biosynthesis protein FliR
MEIPIGFAISEMTAFMLVVARLSGLFLLGPVFSSNMIPMRVKLMALMVLAATMTPIVTGGGDTVLNVPTDGMGLAVAILKETMIGLGLGFAVSLVFTAVQVGASLIDTSIGFSMANVLDPMSNTQNAVFGSFYSMVATLSFLAVNGHHWMLQGFTRSFEIVPVDKMPNFERVYANVFEIFGQLFAVAFQIAAPVLVTLLLVDVVLGIVSRTVPQMNVFFVGIPLKIGIGMAAVVIALPSFVSFFQHRISDIVTGASVLAKASGT